MTVNIQVWIHTKNFWVLKNRTYKNVASLETVLETEDERWTVSLLFKDNKKKKINNCCRVEAAC